jgi:hypothetical protein
MNNSTNNRLDPLRCPYCGGEKQASKFACQLCWRMVPREIKEQIAIAREVAVRWLDEHARTHTSKPAP